MVMTDCCWAVNESVIVVVVVDVSRLAELVTIYYHHLPLNYYYRCWLAISAVVLG